MYYTPLSGTTCTSLSGLLSSISQSVVPIPSLRCIGLESRYPLSPSHHLPSTSPLSLCLPCPLPSLCTPLPLLPLLLPLLLLLPAAVGSEPAGDVCLGLARQTQVGSKWKGLKQQSKFSPFYVS